MKISQHSNILILSHFYKRTSEGGGPPQDIRNFFLPKIKKIFYIEHPFPYANDHRSSLTVYENNKIIKQYFTPQISGPQSLYYIMDIIFTIYFLILAHRTYDLCIALDNLNTVSVLPFKKIGVIRKLIYYSIDFVPIRFENQILNKIYHFFDRVACYYSDTIWILSERMIAERAKKNIHIEKSAPNVLLPMGANLKRIKPLPFNKINRFEIVYVGSLIEKQGVQMILQSLSKVIEKIPQVQLTIIGDGNYKNTLYKLTDRLNIRNHVVFKGFIEEHKNVERILCKAAIAIAPYVTTIDNFAEYTDPGKPKLYLGCSLPIVITNVSAIAHVIETHQAGIIVSYESQDIANALIKLLSNDTLYKRYRDNARKLSKQYDTDHLIQTAIANTP